MPEYYVVFKFFSHPRCMIAKRACKYVHILLHGYLGVFCSLCEITIHVAPVTSHCLKDEAHDFGRNLQNCWFAIKLNVALVKTLLYKTGSQVFTWARANIFIRLHIGRSQKGVFAKTIRLFLTIITWCAWWKKLWARELKYMLQNSEYT